MRAFRLSRSNGECSEIMSHLRQIGVIACALLMPTWPVVAQSFVAPFNTVMTIASTVPKNGDVNPYGLFVVPSTVGDLVAGAALVSNFNNHRNLQGTGSTIVQIAPSGAVSLFASLDPNKLPGACPGGIGLTTALVRAQERLGDRRQPPHERRHLGHHGSGLPPGHR